MDLICSRSCYVVLCTTFTEVILTAPSLSQGGTLKLSSLQQRQSFTEDILACFSTAGDTQEVCKQWMHKAHRRGSKLIYTKKTDSMLLSLRSLAYEAFIWVTMQSIPQNQVKQRTFHSFPICVQFLFLEQALHNCEELPEQELHSNSISSLTSQVEEVCHGLFSVPSIPLSRKDFR